LSRHAIKPVTSCWKLALASVMVAWENGVLYRDVGATASQCNPGGVAWAGLVEGFAGVLARFGQGFMQRLPVCRVGHAGLFHFQQGGLQPGHFQL